MPTAQAEQKGERDDGLIAADAGGFTYLARRPFDPLRLYCLLHSPWPAELDANGCFWIATRPRWRGEIECVRGNVRYRVWSAWWATIPKRDWPHVPAFRAMLEGDWHPTFGDRRLLVAFTGCGLDAVAIRQMLDGCLVDGDDDPASWRPEWSSLPDPFERWGELNPSARREG